jgi:hypothetical protein
MKCYALGKEVDIDNKLRNHLKIKGVINNKFTPQEILNRRKAKSCDTTRV